MRTKNEIFSRYLKDYINKKTTRKKRGEILDNVCDVTGIHRKAAIRKFKCLQLRGDLPCEKRGKKQYYTPDSIAALKTVWEASSEICGELLHPVINDYVTILRRDKLWKHNSTATDKLLKMSEATVKRIVGKFMKARTAKKGVSTTKPSNLKEIIPIFMGPWDDKPIGYGQLNTVVHCGPTLLGDMAYSVNFTDVCTLWVSFGAQLNKGQTATKKSIERIRAKLPFKMVGLHPDTGSEFINWVLKGWCDDERIDLTRSRPNRKNDNAYVEQKNGHVIRRFLGYSKIECSLAIEKMNEMYDKLELYLNHFVPSRKCIEKIRIGSKYKRKYDKAKTAYARVLNHSDIDQAIKDKLEVQHEKLNPLILKHEVTKLIRELFQIQRDYEDKNSNSEPRKKLPLR